CCATRSRPRSTGSASGPTRSRWTSRPSPSQEKCHERRSDATKLEVARLTRSWVLALAAVFTASVPLAAGAVRVNGVATGVIDEFQMTEGEGAAVFGLDGSGLLGRPFRIDFSYDPALAPPDSNPAADRTFHLSERVGPDWLDLAITV